MRQLVLLGLAIGLALWPVNRSAAQEPEHPPAAQAEGAPANGQIPVAPEVEHSAADEHAADAHAAAEHHGEDHGPYSLWTDLPFWSTIAFIGFVAAIFKLGLWKSLTTNMALRETAEKSAIETAEGHLAEAQGLLRSAKGRIEALDETVRETIAEGNRDAQYTRDEFTRIAEKEAAASIDRARNEIERVKNQSLNDLFQSMSEKVANLTEQRLRERLQPDDHRRLIDKMLGEFSAN